MSAKMVKRTTQMTMAEYAAIENKRRIERDGISKFASKPKPCGRKASAAMRYVFLGRKMTATMTEVVDVVSEVFRIPKREIMGRSRLRGIAHARQAAYVLCRGLGKSSTEVGAYFKRDHTCVLYGEKAHVERMKRNADYRAAVHEVELALQSPMFRGPVFKSTRGQK